MQYALTFTTTLVAAPADVWRRVATMPGVNAELGPWVRMSFPAGASQLDAMSMPLGQAAFRSWVWFLGVIPIDRSDVTLVELEPGRRFLERSPMATQHLWQHERTLQPDGAGCMITDRLVFEPRFAGPIVCWFVRKLFNHRHARLATQFGRR